MSKKKSLKESNEQILYAVRGEFYESIAQVLRIARSNAYRAVNFVMVEAYWNIGRMIVEKEQQGKERAEYGKALIRNLAERLTAEFSAGFGATNLAYFRQFYLAFPIFHTLCGESSSASPYAAQSRMSATSSRQLSWSHFKLLLRVEKPEARAWYLSSGEPELVGSGTSTANQFALLRTPADESRQDAGHRRNVGEDQTARVAPRGLHQGPVRP